MTTAGARLPILIVVGWLSMTAIAEAQVSVSLQPGPGAEYAMSLGVDLDALEAELREEIEQAFAVVRPNSYLKAFINSQAFSNKGLGADYASNPTTLSCGVAGNVSAGLDDEVSEEAAVAPTLNVSVMCGVNLGAFDPTLRDLTIYGNVFHYKSEAFVESVEAKVTSAGAHLQYKIFRPKNDKSELIVQWGGLDLTGGVEFSRYDVGLAGDSLLERIPIFNDEASATINDSIVDLDATGRFDMTSTAILIPFEASTNLRIAYLLTLFGGAGIDIQLGQSKYDIELTGDMSTENPGNPNEQLELGTATIRAEGQANPSPGRVRFFGGAQLNLWRFKVFVQANARPAPAAAGLTFGGRIAW